MHMPHHEEEFVAPTFVSVPGEDAFGHAGPLIEEGHQRVPGISWRGLGGLLEMNVISACMNAVRFDSSVLEETGSTSDNRRLLPCTHASNMPRARDPGIPLFASFEIRGRELSFGVAK